MPTLVVPDDFPPALAVTPKALAAARALGEVKVYDTKHASPDELAERIANAEIVINIRAYAKFTADVLERSPRLRLISIWGAGTDNVDLEAARRLGITVTNTPGANAIALAEHTLTLMLAVARHIPQVDRETREGKWPRAMVIQLHGKRLGVIGLGAIGSRVARLGQGIGMEVVAWTFHPSEARARELGVRMVSLDELLRTSDVVSLHVRQTPEAMGMIGRRELSLMKPTAILVNTARGPIVDRAALLEALQQNRIAGAGLDVYDVEPVPADDPLLRLPNVVLTPHSGGMTPEVLETGLLMAVENIANFLAGRPTHVVIPGPR